MFDKYIIDAASVRNIGLAVGGVRLDDVTCTTKTLPDFPGLWATLVGRG